MGVVKRTLGQAIRNWEARRLMTARNKISRKKQLERVWPYPMTKEKRREDDANYTVEALQDFELE
jgi:hypothetical protein